MFLIMIVIWLAILTIFIFNQHSLITKLKLTLELLTRRVERMKRDEAQVSAQDVPESPKYSNGTMPIPSAEFGTSQNAHDATLNPATTTPKPLSQPSLPLKTSTESHWSNPPSSQKNSPITFDAHLSNPRVQSALQRLMEYCFKDGRAVISVGIIILFFGIAFLLKYAVNLFEPTAKHTLTVISLAGFGMIGFGFKLYKDKEKYSLMLQGAGIGVLFMTLYSAFEMYQLIENTTAFVLLALVGVVCIVLALHFNSMILAIFGVVGAFLVPLLTSSGSNNYVGMFNYYIVINLVVLIIAWFKSWKCLNFIGFIFTFVIASCWGMSAYHPEFYSSTQPYLIIFFLIYVTMAVLFSKNLEFNQKQWIDSSLVFGVPLVGYTLQMALVNDFTNGKAISTLIIGLFYSCLWFVFKRYQSQQTQPVALQKLTAAFGALGLIFLSLTIPLYFDKGATASLWALEGVALIWANVHQAGWLRRLFGVILQGFACAMLVLEIVLQSGDRLSYSQSLAASFIAYTGIYSYYLYHYYLYQNNKHALSSFEVFNTTQTLGSLLGFVGLLWWYYAGIDFIETRLTWAYQYAAILGFFAVTSMIFDSFGLKFKLPILTWPAFVIGGFTFFWWLYWSKWTKSIFDNWSIYGWVLAVCAHYLMLWSRKDQSLSHYLNNYHMLGLVLVYCMLAHEIANIGDIYLNNVVSTALIGWLFIPAVFMVAVYQGKFNTVWPIQNQRSLYLQVCLPKIMALSICYFIFTAMSIDGKFGESFYLPILNTADAPALAFILAGLYVLKMSYNREEEWLTSQFYTRSTQILLVLAFFQLNLIILRSVSFYSGIEYKMSDLFYANIVQTSFSIVWTLIAVSLMIIGARHQHRNLWLLGAGVISIVVLKLFVLDLMDRATLTRIVSFIGVGGLMLAVGYFAPIPPSAQPEQK